MQPNTYVHQPHAHHGHRRPMARRIMDVSDMGSLPRCTSGNTQAPAQNMAHAAMDQRHNAGHRLQHHSYIFTCRNRLYRIPRTVYGNSRRYVYTNLRKYALGYAAASSQRLPVSIYSHHCRPIASHEPAHMGTTPTAYIQRMSRRTASRYPCRRNLCRHTDAFRRPRTLRLPPILTGSNRLRSPQYRRRRLIVRADKSSEQTM